MSTSVDLKRKRQFQLLVSGYVKKYSSQYIHKDIISVIHSFHYTPYQILELYSIGNNTYGQQGNGRNEDIKQITKIKTFKKNIKNIVSGDGAAYILFDDQTYECCGYNRYGVLGIGDYNDINVWHQIKDMKIKNIFAAPNTSQHSFCISNDNKLYAVGSNANNQFGIKTNEDKTNKWTPINSSLSIKKVATAWGYTIFLSNNGQIYVAGSSYNGYLGLGKDIQSSPNIQEIQIQIKVKDIYCGCWHTLALDDNYGVWSCGEGGNGRLGHGDDKNRYLATRIEYFIQNNIKIGKICCGDEHNVLLSLNNKIYCFGRNYRYECGNGSNKPVYLPQPNETLKKQTIIDIKCGRFHNIIKTADNKYYLWGHNGYNQCLYVHDSNPPSFIKKPLLFNSHYFNKDQEIIDIYPGFYETRIIIGNKNDQDEKESGFK